MCLAPLRTESDSGARSSNASLSACNPDMYPDTRIRLPELDSITYQSIDSLNRTETISLHAIRRPPQTRPAAEYDSQHQKERGTHHDERQRREEDRVQVLVDEEFKRHALLCALAIRTGGPGSVHDVTFVADLRDGRPHAGGRRSNRTRRREGSALPTERKS